MLSRSALFLCLNSLDLRTNKPLFLTLQNWILTSISSYFILYFSQYFIENCPIYAFRIIRFGSKKSIYFRRKIQSSKPPFLLVFFSQDYSRHPARYIPSLRRGLGRLFFWTIFTFPPPYFLFILPHPSFSLFVTLRFSMSYNWCCKRACFALQKGVFYISKGHLLPCKRCSFITRKGVYWKLIMKNLVSNSLSSLSKTYWKAFQPFILTYSYQSITPTFRLHLTVVNLSFLFIFSIHIQYHLCVTVSVLR